ncbi:hypothetical protein AGMMS50256_38830 [Betaproteobacteria bacterium]|nr:hypothetical protein AGMMS50256_38830 [Betaproteobacteria bacterium]
MTLPSDAQTIRLRVLRGSEGETPVVNEYSIPANAATSLLDALRWVRTHLDDSLAFRHACLNANVCKECMMQLDGKTVYACLAKLESGQTCEVTPLPNKPLLRDLVTEIAPAWEQLFPREDASDDD